MAHYCLHVFISLYLTSNDLSGKAETASVLLDFGQNTLNGPSLRESVTTAGVSDQGEWIINVYEYVCNHHSHPVPWAV